MNYANGRAGQQEETATAGIRHCNYEKSMRRTGRGSIMRLTGRSSKRGAAAGAEGAPRQRRPDGKTAVVVLRVPLRRLRGRGRRRRGLHSPPLSTNGSLLLHAGVSRGAGHLPTSRRALDGRAGSSSPRR
jgi:hypothetical protein